MEQTLATPKFKLKFKNGLLALLYKNFKFELWKSDEQCEAFGIIENGYRFVIMRIKAEDIFQLSYSKNNFDKKDIRVEVIYVDKNIPDMNCVLELFEKTLNNLPALN